MSTLQQEAVADRAKRGAAVLDKIDSDWWQRIDAKNLEMSSCWLCILGQLYGEYGAGIHEVAKLQNIDGSYENRHEQSSFAHSHGFWQCFDEDDERGWLETYEALGSAWVAEINERRAAAIMETTPIREVWTVRPEGD